MFSNRLVLLTIPKAEANEKLKHFNKPIFIILKNKTLLNSLGSVLNWISLSI